MEKRAENHIEEVLGTASALILDTAQNKYNSQWSKISTMQSSASALFGILGVIFTIAAGLNALKISEIIEMYKIKKSMSLILYILVVSIITTNAIVHLYKVIGSKNALDLDSPEILYNRIIPKIKSDLLLGLSKITVTTSVIKELIKANHLAILSLEKVLIHNKYHYRYSLIYSSFSLISVIFLSLCLAVLKIKEFEESTIVFSCATFISGFIISIIELKLRGDANE
ncbi:hypothetical protein HGB47_14955 [Leptospira yasudae]|uniref:hypothetical protein n=1 Tax=Leptospira yasudae TaxID=2202201 RepID=UPI001C4FF03C|nr:hypothetical protein [Leptospira yasudae]MBW0434916.1 hypothetical protein [Leptospira yasudae]